MSAIQRHLMYGLTLLVAAVICTGTASEADDGSTASVYYSDNGFNVQVLAISEMEVLIYWTHPDIDSIVSYYQVSYNVTVRYQTMAGERVFNDTYTTEHLPSSQIGLGIPLYTTNSTYVVQVSAATEDDQIIVSNIYIIPESEFEDIVGQNDAITFFQLGLELAEPQIAFKCSSFEEDYGNVLSLINSQLTNSIQDICSSYSFHNGSSDECAAHLASDHFSCQNNTRIVYVARVVGTVKINATTFLEYLSMLGSIKVSLLSHTFSTRSSLLCPLSIPSAEESDCKPQPFTTENTTVTTNVGSHGNMNATVTTDGGNMNTTVTTDGDSSGNMNTTVTTDGDSSGNMNTTVTTGGSDAHDGFIVVIVAVAFLVGVIILVVCITCAIFVCGRCAGYHKNSDSVDMEKGDLFKVKAYPLIAANTASTQALHLNGYERHWNSSAHFNHSLILPRASLYKDCLTTNQHYHDRNTESHDHLVTTNL